MNRFTNIVVLCWLLYAVSVSAEAEIIRFAGFGDVRIFRSEQFPRHVVLFLSGDGGWNKREAERAEDISNLGALVAGIDARAYVKHMKLRRPCYDPADDLAVFSRKLEKRLGFPTYIRPILLGYSLTSTLVYAAMVQAPPHTFEGAISMGFCPEIPLNRRLCPGRGLELHPYQNAKEKGYVVLPSRNLQEPWLVVQGDLDEICGEQAADQFVQQTARAVLLSLPKVGHGFRVEKNWLEPFTEEFHRLFDR